MEDRITLFEKKTSNQQLLSTTSKQRHIPVWPHYKKQHWKNWIIWKNSSSCQPIRILAQVSWIVTGTLNKSFMNTFLHLPIYNSQTW